MNPSASPPPADLVETIATALRHGAFDPQHAGELFLRADAQAALRDALGQQTRIIVAGRDEGAIRPVTFMGARFAPDLIVEAAGGRRYAVTITLLRGDASPVAHALATALVLATRYAAVVALLLDRRLAKRNPFGGDEDDPSQRDLTAAERTFLAQLWEHQRVHVEVRRQDPFGF